MPASTSMVWNARTFDPRRLSLPARFIRQPRSPPSGRLAPVRSIAAAFSSTTAFEIAGYSTQKVPPTSRQKSLPSSLRISRPTTSSRSIRG